MAIFFAFALLDTVLPALLWASVGIRTVRNTPEVLSYPDVVSGLGAYLGGYVLLFTSFYVFSRVQAGVARPISWILKRRLFWILLTLFLALTLLELWITISEYGSIAEWFAHKIKWRWEGKLPETDQPIWSRVLSYLPSSTGFNLLVLIGYYYRHHLKRPLLLGIVFPLLAIGVACTTFFRGSILLLVLGFAFVEFMRIARFGSDYARAAKYKAVKWAIASISLFMVYGIVRTELSARAWNAKPKSESYVYTILNQGSGLRGASAIVKNYSDRCEYLWGKTYIDMLLLPVPRSIYKTKPEWYGIDDITRGMGWPRSTQAAVTMPGEAFANFGWLGPIAVMPTFGLFFAILYRCCAVRGSPLMFLYPSVIMYILFVASWMAFTGIATRFTQIVACLLILKILFWKRPAEDVGNLTGAQEPKATAST
jgi:oligosaccharide repeat unit polymerase